MIGPLAIQARERFSQFSFTYNPKVIANDIMQLAKSVKTDANKVTVSIILPRKDKGKEVNTYILIQIYSYNLVYLKTIPIHSKQIRLLIELN